MATYIGIKGVEIQTIAGDPANPVVGQVWYNTTANTLKSYGLQGAGTWAAGGDVNTSRLYTSGAGTQTAALFISGDPYPTTPAYSLLCEEYNGTSWAEVNEVNTGKKNVTGGMGTTTACINTAGQTTAGYVPAIAEEYNGTSWAEIADLNTGRSYGGSATNGTPTACQIAGGGSTAASHVPGVETEQYNGTCWAETANLNVGRWRCSGMGSNTAALVCGDANAPEEDKVESWNGTSWTADTDLNGGGYCMGGAGTQTTAFVVGGNPTVKRHSGGNSQTEQFDGSTWTEVADMTGGVSCLGVSGNSDSSLAFSGDLSGSPTLLTYEFSLTNATKTFTSS